MNYNQAVEYLKNAAVTGSKQGLSSFKALLELMGSPQNKLNIIHVAGTNGKGSFCGYLSSVLMAAGYNTGVFTSPHLVKYNERFCYNGKCITDEELAEEITAVSQCVDKFFNGSGDYFSFFEIMTAVCFSYFSKLKTDFLILETGLGGRLDATNAVTSPLFTAIMKIDYDHTELLGSTLEEIAAEKAGIIKPYRPCVLYPNQPKILPVIKRFCDKNNSALFYNQYADINIINSGFSGTEFDVCTADLNYKGLFTKMFGAYQPKNIVPVLTGIELLNKMGFKIPEKAVYEGIKNAKICGRMEIVKTNPTIIADGAHNLNAAEEFSAYTKTLNRKITLVTGVLADKSPEKLIKKLAENAYRVILTVPPSKRAFNPQNLRLPVETYFEKDPKMALAKALTFNDGIIFVTGSLYLVGEVKSIMKGK